MPGTVLNTPVNTTMPDFNTIMPEIVVLLLAIVLLMVDLFTPRNRKQVLTWISVVGYVIALGTCIYYFNYVTENGPVTSFAGMAVLDHLGLWFRILAILSALLGTFFAANFIEEKGMPLGEFYSVLALAALGMMLVGASHDLTAVFVGIELSSIATYIMTGFARDDKLSNEAALKYFLLGGFSTAILVYGMAWLYGMTGTSNIPLIASQVSSMLTGGQSLNGGMLLAILILLAGLGFKIAAVPFHMWTPDAYQGAPTPVTAIMSVGPKAAGFAAIARIVIEGLGPAWQTWTPIVAALAVLTMTVGNVIALAQRSVKRMLAYSSIAHTGYILIAVAAFTPQDAQGNNLAVGSMLFYLFAYVFMNIGAFGLVIWLQRNGGTEFLEDFRGLSTWAPLPAAAMLLLLLSLAGIPPTIGFLGKYYVFLAAVQNNLTWLAVVGVLNSAVAAFYYLRVIWYMYFEEAPASRPQKPGSLLAVGLGLSAVVTIVFFVLGGIFLDLTQQSIPLVTAGLIDAIAGK